MTDDAQPPRPRAGTIRVVPGWLWLQGKEQQDREWDTLMTNFWGYIHLNTWEMAVVRKWMEVDEQRGQVILHMEADVLGKITPGSLKISSL